MICVISILFLSIVIDNNWNFKPNRIKVEHDFFRLFIISYCLALLFLLFCSIIQIRNNTNVLKHLCMLYGTEYCASEECYKIIREIIKTRVESIDGATLPRAKNLVI